MTHKGRLPCWLKHHLDSETFSGVCWIDRTNGIFKLPWWHRAHKEYFTKPFQIFLSWGIYKEQTNPGLLFFMLLTATTKFGHTISKSSYITALPAHDKARAGGNSYRVLQFTIPPDIIDAANILLDISENYEKYAADDILLPLYYNS